MGPAIMPILQTRKLRQMRLKRNNHKRSLEKALSVDPVPVRTSFTVGRGWNHSLHTPHTSGECRSELKMGAYMHI